MKQKKVKLTADDILQLYTEKPLFDRSETNSSTLYGWSSTKHGLYNITDFYRYFEAKGFSKNDVDEVLYKYFQKYDYNNKLPKMEKGKTHYIKMIGVFNFHPDYKKGSRFLETPYYYIDISDETAKQLKKEYEVESKRLIKELLEKKPNRQPEKSAAQKSKAEKLKPKKTKKSPVVEIELK